MADDIKKKKISELPQATNIEGLLSLGVDGTGKSVKVPIELLKGNKGDKGEPPVIGSNGNWWVGGADTGKPARGEDGTVLTYKTIYNVSQVNSKYNYADRTTARNAVPANLRSPGQIVVYKLSAGDWVVEKYIGNDINGWAGNTNWEAIGGDLMSLLFIVNKSSAGNYLRYDYITRANYEANVSGGLSIIKYPLQRGTTYRISGVKVYHTRYQLYPGDDDGAVAFTDAAAESNGNPVTFTTPSDKDSYFSYTLCDPSNATGYGIYDVRDTFLLSSESHPANTIRLYFDKAKTRYYDITENADFVNILHSNELLNNELRNLKSTDGYDIDSDTGALVASPGYTFVSGLPVYKGDSFEYRFGFAPSYMSRFYIKDGNGITRAIYGANNSSAGAFVSRVNGYMYLQTKRADTGRDISSFDESLFTLRRKSTSLVLPDRKIRDKELPIIVEGNPPHAPVPITMTERPGHINPDGSISNTNDVWQGVISESPILDKNSYYLIELGDIVRGRIIGTVGGHPIALAGRKTLWIKTDDRDNQRLVLFVKGNLSSVVESGVWNVIGKYKVYKVEEPAIIKSANYIGKLPSVGADYSSAPSATIPEPRFIFWNIYGHYPNLTASTNYNKSSNVVEYLDSNGNYFRKYATIGGQGSGSMSYENHNSKYKLTNHDGSKFVLKIGDWLPRSTFHFKVNYVDFSQAKNQGAANYVTDWYRDIKDPTRKTYPWDRGKVFNVNDVRLDLYDNRARGVIASVPCMICTYWNPWSQATMNLNAFAENFKLDANNPLHRGYRGGLGLAKNNWEEMVSDTEGNAMSDETWKPFKDFTDWMSANRSAARMQDFIAGDGIRYDKDDMIDYWLMAEFMYMYDNGWANMVWISYDSVKFTPMWYDMDTCFGSTYTGSISFNPNQAYTPNGGTFFWEALIRAYPEDIKNRYNALRESGRFSVDKIRDIFGELISRFPYEWYEIDFNMWVNRNSIKPGHFASLERYLWFTESRLRYLDNKYGYNG